MIEGSWGGGQVPSELINFALMREFHWTFAALADTPMYVLRYCWDLLQASKQHEHDQAESQRRSGG